MRPVLLLDIVGLSPRLVGSATPHLDGLAGSGTLLPMAGVFPALTCPAQASMVTGLAPSEHGVVGNGWYFRDTCEVRFWLQSNRLVGGGRLWEGARAAVPGLVAANLFWWYNMYSSVDLSITPRPIYRADGKKLFAVYSEPPSLAADVEARIGAFPFPRFWGPLAGLASTSWIVDAAIRLLEHPRPGLLLAYLPHLDYDLQRFGPDHPAARTAVADVDREAGRLIEAARAAGYEVVVVSEYGIEGVSRPVHVNRVLREAGLLRVRDELGHEALDAGASRAFAVSDHQIAHVYVRDAADLARTSALLAATPGIERVLGADDKRALGVDHPRAGELVAVAEPDAWFTYYYWLDDARAPDFARSVDIHRKPGYDPAELFFDPSIRVPALAVLRRLLRSKLGFRTLFDVVPMDAGLVRGSHGRAPRSPGEGPVLISSRPLARDAVRMTDVPSIVMEALAGAD